MKKMNEVIIDKNESWRHALNRWSNPSIPHVISPENLEEITDKEIALILEGELAFMKYEP